MNTPRVLSTLPTGFPAPAVTAKTIAHRGGGALRGENTFSAFQHAYELGCRIMETDVQITADGYAVAFHDDTLDRVTDHTGPIRSYTLADLAKVRVHGPDGTTDQVPLLVDLFDAFDCQWIVDVKHGDSIVPLAESIVAAQSTERTCVSHNWDSWLYRVEELTGPGLQRMVGWQSLATLIAHARQGSRPPQEALSAPWVHIAWETCGVKLMSDPVFAQRFTSMCHDLGAGVRVWTVNDPAHMGDLFDLGVDGIFTDRPDLCLHQEHAVAP